MTTDPTITIAGLETRIGVLSEALHDANRGRADTATAASKLDARLAATESERDALAAQLAEARAALDAAPKVCAIHSYEHGPGPCMTCGAWPPGTRELIAACQTRIAGLEQAADERSAEVARLTARVAELEARPVFAGVSEDDLCVQMLMAADPSIDPGIALVMVNGVHRAKVRAVLARLEVSLVAPVDPEQMARDFAAGVPVRATLIARGIPVTPEVGK